VKEGNNSDNHHLRDSRLDASVSNNEFINSFEHVGEAHSPGTFSSTGSLLGTKALASNG